MTLNELVTISQESSLQQQLNALKQEFLSQAPPETVAALETATTELVRSGILDRCLKEGAKAPLFELPDAAGLTFRLADSLKRGPAVIAFYRGGW
jgi:hypothetical protein